MTAVTAVTALSPPPPRSDPAGVAGGPNLGDAIPPRLPVTTAARVTFHLAPAGLGTRAVAWMVDAVLGWVVKLVGVYAIFQVLDGGLGFALVITLFFAVDVAYFAFFEARWAGQTPGKRWAGLRVVTTEGGRLDAGPAVLRNLVRVLDSLPRFMVVGFVVAYLHPHHRRLGDLLAGTVVVAEPKRRAGASVLDEAGVVELKSRENSLATAPIAERVRSRITIPERDLLLDLAARRESLDPLPRAALFRDAAELCRRRFDLPDLAHLSDEQTVLGVALLLGEG